MLSLLKIDAFISCMQTAETWAEFQFAAFNPQWLVKSDVIGRAACIVQKTEPLESQISVLGLQSATARSTIYKWRAWKPPNRGCPGGSAHQLLV